MKINNQKFIFYLYDKIIREQNTDISENVHS